MRRRLRLLSCLPVLVALSAAGSGVTAGPVTLTGRVADPQGRPLGGAEVWITRNAAAAERVAVTAADGRFEVPGLSRYQFVLLDVCRDGYFFGGDLRHEKEMVFVHGENRMDFITLPSSPDQPVRGRVREPSGRPVSWAHVHFSDLRPGTERLPSPHFAPAPTARSRSGFRSVRMRSRPGNRASSPSAGPAV
jgi:hypothetical protein